MQLRGVGLANGCRLLQCDECYHVLYAIKIENYIFIFYTKFNRFFNYYRVGVHSKFKKIIIYN